MWRENSHLLMVLALMQEGGLAIQAEVVCCKNYPVDTSNR